MFFSDTDATDIMNSSIKAEDKRGVWTALCVVQSYDGRRKIPRSDISLSHFESCLKKVALAASKCSGMANYCNKNYLTQKY